jgi:hypothetical protein
MKDPCPPACKLKCREKIIQSQRQQIFDSFWGSGDCQQRWIYIANHVICMSPIVRRLSTTRPRTVTKHYFLSVPQPESSNPDRIRVGQKFFLATLDTSPKTVSTALDKYGGRSNANVA